MENKIVLVTAAHEAGKALFPSVWCVKTAAGMFMLRRVLCWMMKCAGA